MKWCKALKKDIRNFADGIKSAASLEDINNLSLEIENLKRDFSAKRVILDQSLYPENFDSSFDNLYSSVELRRGDFTSINVLQTEVTTLKSEVDLLNRRNTELINQITVLESQRQKRCSINRKVRKPCF